MSLNELVLFALDKTPEHYFTEENILPVLAQVTEAVRAYEVDISSEKGRKDLKSLAYKVARSKTTLDEMGTTLTESWRKKTTEVNGIRNKIKKELDDLKDELLAPLTKWEAKEVLRVKERQDKLNTIRELRNTAGKSSGEIRLNFLTLKDINEHGEDFWQEFYMIATKEINTTLGHLNAAVAEAQNKELEEARVAEEKRQQEELDKKANEEKIAEAARLETQRIADEKAAELLKEQTAKEEKLKQDKIDSDNKLRIATENAEKLRLENIKKDEDNKKRLEQIRLDNIKKDDENKKRLEKIKSDNEAAQIRIKAEADKAAQKKVDDKIKADKEEQDRKERDLENRKKIHCAARDAIKDSTGIDEGVAQLIVTLIASKKIPNVSITY